MAMKKIFINSGAALFLCLSAVTSAQVVPLDRIVALVNDDAITELQLQKQMDFIKAQLANQSMTLPSDSELRSQILERLIVKQLQLQLADINHIRVDDEMLNSFIDSMAERNNMSVAKFRDQLIKDGFDYVYFREELRSEITINQLRQRQVDSRIIVTEREIDNYLENRQRQDFSNFEYLISHILVSVPEAASPDQINLAKNRAEEILAKLAAGETFAKVAVAMSDGQQALQGGSLGWRRAGEIPSLFTEVVFTLKPGEVSGLIRSSSGFHIIRLDERRGGEDRNIVDQTLVSHILIKTNALIQDQDARIRLQQLKKRIEGGEDMVLLARAHSEDTVSAAKGGDLGWVSPGDMVPEFEEVLKQTKKGSISEPFKTRFGWHILKVQDYRQHDNTEAMKRRQAQQIVRQRKIEEEVETWIRRLRDESYVEIRSKGDS